MALYDQQQTPTINPPPVTAYPLPPPAQRTGYPQDPLVAAPPPTCYPSKDCAGYPQHVPIETKSKGDGFWKGCFAALCCCCVLDVCCC